ncbi:ribosomal RNA small subunit methyltransferase A, partial [Candidatus Micrarchaeota archaeon CG11_big_fil_rev_8_21_14_0_20_47_5]
GQNFLKSASVLRYEASLVNVEEKNVLEIGAGDGRLSEKIIEGKPAKLVLVEKDREFAKMLKERFAGEKCVEVRGEDVLETDLKGIDAVFGNIPYYLSSPILFLLAKSQVKECVLCVQKEFAQRLVAKAGSAEYGRLSVSSGAYFDIALKRVVPAGLFFPKPKVDSAIVALKRKEGGEMDVFEEEFVMKIFSHRRQKLKKAIQHSYGKKNAAKKEAIDKSEFADRKVYTLSEGEIKRAARELRGILHG